MIKKLLLVSGVTLMSMGAMAQEVTVEITPEQDNSIYSESENSNGTGEIFSGYTCDSDIRRALIQFDIESMLPPGATVTGARVIINQTNAGPSASSEIYTLHKVTTAWGEGTSFGTGTGGAAEGMDATWLDAMFGTSAWTTEGGDFIGTASASQTLTGVDGLYTFDDAGLLSDVNDWLGDPSTNFGWILVGDETADCTARRFGSKDVGTAPVLELTYECVGGVDPTAVCQSLTLELDELGEGTISAEDLDGGSVAYCGGELTFAASVTAFSCEDIFDGPIPPSLIISGTFDGPLPGGLPKGVELYVVNDIDDLSTYGIGSANNGGGTDGEEFTLPAASASAGDYIYITSDSLAFVEFFGFSPQYESGSMSINGDDAIELFQDGAVIDVFGEIDVDGTGQPWEYLDGWAYRVSDTGPDGAVFTIDNWMFSGINVLDGELTNAGAGTPVPVGTFTTAPTVGVSVELTVTDEDGLTATCVTAVNVIDVAPPVMECVGEATFVLDETGMIEITADDLDDGTADGCGLDELSISETTFTCEDAGENEVMLYATDIYGNTDSCMVTVTIDASEVITVDEIVVSDASCFEFLDGSIDVSVSGGGTLSYDWDNDGTGDFDDTEDLATIGAGTYILVVQDDMGCQATAEAEVGEPEEITITGIVIPESCPGAADGAVTLEILGGTAPYEIVGEVSGLTEGVYSVTVTDVSGCNSVYDFTVTTAVIIDPDITISMEDGTLTAVQNDAAYQWYNCDLEEEIDGATDQTYMPTATANYACIITLDGCTDTTNCVLYETSSIQELTAGDVLVYPNPSNGIVTVKWGADFNANIRVLDLKGSVIATIQNANDNTQVDLSSFDNGIYFVEIRTADALVTKKVTIQK